MKKTFLAFLLGTVVMTTPIAGYAVDAKTQAAIFYTMSAVSITTDAINAIAQAPTVTWSGTYDISSYLVDALQIVLYRKRRTKWSEVPEELQAVARQIGDEGASEEYDTLPETDVHIMALTNTGIEALYDGAEVSPEGKLAAYLSSAGVADVIREKFGTPHVDASALSSLSGVDFSNLTNSLPSGYSIPSGILNDLQNLTGGGGNQAASGSQGENTDTTKSETKAARADLRKELDGTPWTDATLDMYHKRRLFHKQKTSLTGVAKAELLQSVSATDNSQKRISQLEGFVGKGESLSGQAKILAGLELELAGRLNMLNAVQGNTLAVDAADALDRVED